MEPQLDLPPVFDTKTALGSGFTSKQLRGPRVTRLLRGTFATATPDDLLEAFARAALLVAGPESSLCEVTALRMAGVDVPARFSRSDEPIHLHLPIADRGPQRTGVQTHHTQRQLPINTVAGHPALHLAECWLQLAARATVLELVVVGDGLMRRPRPPRHQPFLVEPITLSQAVAQSHRRPGIRTAREAVALVRPGTDSPMESVTRFRLVRAGLPQPYVNYPILDATGWPVYFLDLAYPEQQVAVEYDGAIHVADTIRMQDDAHRRRRLEDDGWRLITATARDLPDGMATIAASVRAALASRGHPAFIHS